MAALLAIALFAPPAAAREPEPAGRNVFILHSYSLRVPYTVVQDTAIRETIARRLDIQINFFTFELDASGDMEDTQAWLPVALFLKSRYAARPIDVIVCTDTPAARFLELHGEEIFPGVPIVGSALTEIPGGPRAAPERMTGVVESLAIAQTIDLIRRFHPEVRRLWAINTPGSYGSRLKAETEAALQTLLSPPTIEWLPLLDTNQMSSLLRTAPTDAAILWLNYWDPSGQFTKDKDVVGRFSEACPRPIYSLYDTYLGLGVVGGFMASAETYGMAAGNMASRILEGEPISSIELLFGANPIMLDARQLARFGVDPASVPAGSRIRFVELSFLERNGRIIAIAAAIAAIEGVIIAGLIVSLRRMKSAEAALRDAERRLRVALKAGNMATWEWDLDAQIFHHSDGMGPMFNLPPGAGSTPQSPVIEQIVPEDRPVKLAAVHGAFGRPDGVLSVDYRVGRPDGTVRWLSCQGRVIQDEAGSKRRLFGVTIDITGMKEAEAALRESEERYRALVEALPIGICVHDGERIMFANEALRTLLLAPTIQDVLNVPFDRVIHPDDLHHRAGRVRSVLAEGMTAEPIEVRVIAADGRAIEVEICCMPLQYGGRRMIQTTVADLTERKKAESAIRESEEKFRQITENAAEVFWLTDADSNSVRYLSPAFERVWGRPREPFINESDRFYETIHPDDRERVERSSRNKSKGFDHEFRIVRPDGATRWIRDRAYPVPDQSGRTVRVAGVAQDITEAKAAEESLRRTAHTHQLLLSELDHRVKNSLSGLVTLIELTRTGATTISEFADSIRARVRAMASVHAILSDTHWAPVPLNRLIATLIPPGLAGAIHPAGTNVEIPSHQVTALAMIVQELMTNSVKYGAAGAANGAIHIEWHSEKPDSEGESQLIIHWTERGGPTVPAAIKPSTGLRLIEGFCRFELGGSSDFTFAPEGARHTIVAALSRHVETPRSSLAPITDGFDRSI